MDNLKKLVVIPSEPLHLYEKKGIYTWLERYYNPGYYFDKVYLISPLEKKREVKYGMEIIPVTSGREFKRIVREIQPLCVRTYGAYWATSFGIINKIKGIPVVASIHDPNPAFIFKGITRASFIFSMSQRLTEILLHKGVSQDVILTTGNRVDFTLFRRLEKDHEDVKNIRNSYPQGSMLLHVGRRTEVKNLITTVSALAHLPEDHFLVIVGRGTEADVDERIAALNISHRIFDVASVANNELPYWFNACDVFVTPSLWEGFGVVFLEAAACRTKMVTSNITPLNTFLTDDGNTVSLVDAYKDPVAIASAIRKIAQEEGSSTMTYDFIKKKYSIEAIEEIEINFYTQLMDGTLEVKDPISYLGRKVYHIEHTLSEASKTWKRKLRKSTKLKKVKQFLYKK